MEAGSAGADRLGRFLDVLPSVVVGDAHPGYHSRRRAVRTAARLGVAFVDVQHHHAHVAALLAEHEVAPGEDVIGITFDGTGYGGDGTLWGGEVLVGSYHGVERRFHLRPVPLPGGEAGIRHPCRVALSYLSDAGVDPEALAPTGAMHNAEAAVVQHQLTMTSTPRTSSMGRMFDAVASILGIRHRVSFEAQAAIDLESLAWQARSDGPRLEFVVGSEGVIDGRGVGARTRR